MALDPRLRSPKEKPLFVIGVVFSALVWLALVVSARATPISASGSRR